MDAPIDDVMLPILQVLKEKLSPVYLLLHDLLKQHKTIKERDVHAWGEQYTVKCMACDGNVYHIWAPGDEEYKCAFSIRAEKLGLV